MFDTRFIGFIGSQLHIVVYLGGSLCLSQYLIKLLFFLGGTGWRKSAPSIFFEIKIRDFKLIDDWLKESDYKKKL